MFFVYPIKFLFAPSMPGKALYLALAWGSILCWWIGLIGMALQQWVLGSFWVVALGLGIASFAVRLEKLKAGG